MRPCAAPQPGSSTSWPTACEPSTTANREEPGQDHRAISVQLARVTRGQSRLLLSSTIGRSPARSAVAALFPKLIVRVRFSSPAQCDDPSRGRRGCRMPTPKYDLAPGGSSFSGAVIAARPPPRSTFERVGIFSDQGNSLSKPTSAGNSPPARHLPSCTPALPQPRSPHPHSGTRATQQTPSASITATPSDSSGSPAHASTSTSQPRFVPDTRRLRPRRTPMSARHAPPPITSTRSARRPQPSPAIRRSPGNAVTVSAIQPPYEVVSSRRTGPCPPRARKEGHPRRFTVIHGATSAALDLCDRRSAGRGHLLCKQGSEVQVPLAPPGKTPSTKIVKWPSVGSHAELREAPARIRARPAVA